MSPERAAAGPWEGPADGKSNIGLDVLPQDTTRPRRSRVFRATCSEGHRIESAEAVTACPAYVGGAPCRGVIG